MENLAFHSSPRWKMIKLPILTTLLYTIDFRRLGECTSYNPTQLVVMWVLFEQTLTCYLQSFCCPWRKGWTLPHELRSSPALLLKSRRKKKHVQQLAVITTPLSYSSSPPGPLIFSSWTMPPYCYNVGTGSGACLVALLFCTSHDQ